MTEVGKRSTRKSSFLSVAVTAIVVPGLFATIALPAYAYTAPESTKASDAAAALTQLKQDAAQSVDVAADVVVAPTGRDAFTATTAAELRRAQLAAQYAAYSGPRVSDFLANPPYPSFSLDQVVSVGMQYQGAPYAYGGSTPAGFDCSGFTMFVYAQFGISLPHGGGSQGRMGTAIAPSAALPGDIVVLDGGAHVGIYMGGNSMLDAPYEGQTVGIHTIYTSNHYFVRFGI